MQISGISAVVTGGASGLGGATARALAEAGAKVAVFDLNKDAAEAMAKEIGGVACVVDVTKDDQLEAAFEKAAAAQGIARILVNCAGIGISIRTVGRNGPHPIDSFRKVIEVNLIGGFNAIRRASQAMSTLDPLDDGERGVCINTASVAAYDGQIGQAAYSASKGGIVGMTLPIARDLASLGIRVCTIAPGLFDTPLMQALPDDVKAALGSSVPFPRRLGLPSEYAALAKHIVENNMLNGETIRLDGAIRMAPK
ncbi:SDR family NAD(P)-dependent oxidoreductase [Oceanibacterium hippocampi]|uniref:3-oxoacyl-[acyl-carrier-protein] reductase FabG n=1 Tax=Oceanibacterium hippocampi TaxID=745714 RepID=A0A1Y5RAK6_9PROT|nr:SDR family NAD(P)-dependent oxidoreductase [Oceanibacterium hippocampi]SLN12254.1 3-oxoacyl-[acyl-carrier-protein] reductase FabG [Oceanibacterium hippocampi]